MTIDVPAEWSDNFIRHAVHYGTTKPITEDEISSVTIEEVLPAIDPNQGGLFDDTAKDV